MYIVSQRELEKNDEFERGIYTCSKVDIKEFLIKACSKEANTEDEAVKEFQSSFNRNWNTYKNGWISFDTETSKVYLNDNNVFQITCPIKDEKKSKRIDYVYMLQISMFGTIGYTRHIKEFVALINKFEDTYMKGLYRKCKDYQKPIMVRMYGFNASYDLMFIKDFFKYAHPNIGVKASEMKSWNLTEHIEFIDAQGLVGNQSLKDAVRDFGYNISKADLDHTKFRSPNTTLTKYEISYCLDDVYYLDRFLEGKIKNDQEGIIKDISDMPYTKTAEVKSYMDKVKYEEYKITLKEAEEAYGKYLCVVDILPNKFDLNKKNIVYFKDGFCYKFIKERNKDRKLKKLNIKQIETELIKHRVGKLYSNKDEFKDEYEMIEAAFAGGFTHANMKKLGVLCPNVVCTDLSSAYPSEMLTQKFVYGYSETLNDCPDYNPITKSINNTKYGYLIEVEFKNLRHLRTFGTISYHKCDTENSDGVDIDNKNYSKNNDLFSISYDNGRVTKAKKLRLTMIDTDFNVMKKFYTWDDVKFIKIRRGKKYHLPRIIAKTIEKFYYGKCVFKSLTNTAEDEEKIKEYMIQLTLSKQKLNSVYGLCVKNEKKYRKEKVNLICNTQTKDEIEDEFYSEKCKYKEPLIFAFGAQITSYTRRRLFDIIDKISDDKFVYSDTDSIYFMYDEKLIIEIEKYSEIMQNELNKAIDYYDLDSSKWYVKQKDGNVKKAFPAKFDFDTIKKDGKEVIEVYPYFITSGSKRYLKIFYTNNKLNVKPTIAGISKDIAKKYILKKCKTPRDVKRLFIDGLTIPVEESKKKYHKYVDIYNGEFNKANDRGKKLDRYTFPEKIRRIILPDGCEVFVGSWVSLFDVPFEMNYKKTMERIMFNMNL